MFFGLVATAGSAYVQHAPFTIAIGGHGFVYSYNWAYALWAGVPVGLLAAALLEANNVRDLETDTEAGQEDAGRAPRPAGRGLSLHRARSMAAAVGIGIVAHYEVWALIALAAMPLAIAPVRLALSDKRGRELLPMLGDTARLQIVGGVLLALGVLL